MVSIHTTRHCILYKRTSTRPHSTYRTFTKESQTFTTLLVLHGTKHYKFTIEPTTTLRANTNNILDLDVHVDADWAGCPGTSKRAKRIDLKFLYTQDLIKHDIIRILKINTLHNSADLFTKYISKETLQRLVQSIGIRI